MVRNPPVGPRNDWAQAWTGRCHFLNNDMGCTGEADLEKTQAFILSPRESGLETRWLRNFSHRLGKIAA